MGRECVPQRGKIFSTMVCGMEKICIFAVDIWCDGWVQLVERQVFDAKRRTGKRKDNNKLITTQKTTQHEESLYTFCIAASCR